MMSQQQVHRGFTLGDVDNISQLPDELIGNILSRLPTIEAVKTCVLSKAWEHKWMHISKIGIDCTDEWVCQEKLPNFVSFMQKMFRHVQNVMAIDFVSNDDELFGGNYSSELESFVSGFLKFRADILKINLMCNESEIVIQGRLLSAETLRELELCHVNFEGPHYMHFPLLKTLHLLYVHMSNKADNTTLKFTLPVLETLVICECYWGTLTLVEIYVPSLRTLDSTTEYNDYSSEEVEIKIVGAASPMVFHSSGELNILFVGSNIVSARILDLSPYYNLEMLSRSERIAGNLLRESLSTIVDLKLSVNMAQIFVKALLEFKHGFSVPVFCKLERLVLRVENFYPSDISKTETLLGVLHAAPYLKFLGIQIWYDHWDDYDYDAVESLPSCLLSTLEEIDLRIVTDNDDQLGRQLRLVKFLVRCGEKFPLLKRFDCKIELGDDLFNRMMEEISSFPRAPPHFTICAISLSSPLPMKRFGYRESCGWVEDV